jgi:transposase
MLDRIAGLVEDPAAWIGLVPRQNSSGGKDRLGGISKQGHRYLRQMLAVGAMAVIHYAQRHSTRRPWLARLLTRRTTKVAAVALADQPPNRSTRTP